MDSRQAWPCVGIALERVEGGHEILRSSNFEFNYIKAERVGMVGGFSQRYPFK
jgi:hypothetical protein